MEILSIEKAIDLVNTENQIREQVNLNLTGMRIISDYDIVQKKIPVFLEQLKAYKDAEEQGLLLKLPCKVGTVLYNPVPYYYIGTKKINVPFILETKVVGFGIENMQLNIKAKNGPEIREFTVDRIGTSFFLTKEEAVKVIEEWQKGGQNG